jgi:hypothetical protein
VEVRDVVGTDLEIRAYWVEREWVALILVVLLALLLVQALPLDTERD